VGVDAQGNNIFGTDSDDTNPLTESFTFTGYNQVLFGAGRRAWVHCARREACARFLDV
jgi:hypothetical protein